MKALAFAFALACLLVPRDAFAISADVARSCNALVAKQFPPRQPGNPAAGSAKGDAKAERAYFEKCVANGGKMDEQPAKSDEAPKQGK
jgi:hypothetical protein